MRDQTASNRRRLWPLLFILCLIVIASLAEPVGSEPLARAPAVDLASTWAFSGRVYDGVPYDPSNPIQGVTISLYGSNNPASGGNYGQLLDHTVSSSSGWWVLSADDRIDGIWEYYYLVETQPTGYASIDATSVGGAKCGNDCIVYTWPLSGKTFTGNKFWDRSSPTTTPTATSSPRPTSTPTITPRISATPSSTLRVSATPSQTPQVTATVTPEEPPTRGPITFPEGNWPWYAQGEITVHPEPPIAGSLTRLCVEVHNSDQTAAHDADLEFRVANFGIGVPFSTVGVVPVHMPPDGWVQECVLWTPPVPGHWCIEVVIHQEGFAPQRSQRNIDLDEPLQPGEAHTKVFPVGNPSDQVATITLGIVPHLPDWTIELSPDILPDMQPGEIREVALTVQPPVDQPLPPDGHAVVDVEAYIEGELIGGFRKVFRPSVPLHRLPDPSYAESEITISPYPPRAGEPTEICVELRNPTDAPQDVQVQFAWATFGVGIPFTPIDGLRPVHLPPQSIVKECIHWIPPVGGNVCIQVTLYNEGYEPQVSQRNMDVDEPLQPGVPHTRVFPVGNPFEQPVTVTLGLVPHLVGWGLELSQDVLPNMQPGEVREVSLAVTPPSDSPLPPDGQPIVDVEVYAEGELIGGFRKIYRPPVSVHQPKNPVYAESEIGIDPYPVIAGRPTTLRVELFNPTPNDVIVSVTFAVADFGIGLPFDSNDILPNPVQIFVPAHGAASGQAVWDAPAHSGRYCVEVRLDVAGQEPIYSRRNVDVGEPLHPGEPHELAFRVGNYDFDGPVTIRLAAVKHMLDWQVAVEPAIISDLGPGNEITATLIVTPPEQVTLGTGQPIVDVEAYVGDELLGGFRKLDIPPVPVHKPHEKGYAESEITVDPEPPQLGEPCAVGAELFNASEQPVSVEVSFGWANFGLGIPFRQDGMDPITQTVVVPPLGSAHADTTFTPLQSGHQCILLRLQDTLELYEPQVSQRNVDVTERPDCGVAKVFTFTVYNDSPFTVTVDLGLITFNVPPDWQVSTDPSGSAEIEPFSELEIEVSVQIPCASTQALSLEAESIRRLQSLANSLPKIDVEGYVNGDLVGGIEILFDDSWQPQAVLSLPLVLRGP